MDIENCAAVSVGARVQSFMRNDWHMLRLEIAEQEREGGDGFGCPG